MRNSSGNILFLLLIGIALFAALSFAAMDKTGSNDQMEIEKATVEATELIQYARNLTTAYRRLRITNQCQPEDISFEIAEWTSGNPGTNASSPADGSCNIFHENGGKAVYKPYKKQRIYGDIAFLGNGNHCADSSCTELYLLYRLAHSNTTSHDYSNAEAALICNEINRQLFNYASTDATMDLTRTLWNGSFGYSDTFDAPAYAGQRIFCTREGSEIYSFIIIFEVR